MNSSTESSASFKSKTSGHTPASGPSRKITGSVGNSAAFTEYDTSVLGRVRVAVRLRPRNADEMAADADCVELQPELKRLKL
ncbi:hypothetical protein K7X08_029315 [Anisodus acutangulus]|uniref:Kinesin motor domain-containing protein n=1 Tax=Anisodus acutangulus TaxID=402998 RepID=A0A9Q1L441_9SOLA|nr:hypothetical protein K7X08_029315 [Anisodus acutangulus]